MNLLFSKNNLKRQSTKGSRTSLPESVKGEMESGFGADFSGVKFHTDFNALQMSKEINAQAFTHGNDNYFSSGRLDVGIDTGKGVDGFISVVHAIVDIKRIPHAISQVPESGATLHKLWDLAATIKPGNNAYQQAWGNTDYSTTMVIMVIRAINTTKKMESGPR